MQSQYYKKTSEFLVIFSMALYLLSCGRDRQLSHGPELASTVSVTENSDHLETRSLTGKKEPKDARACYRPPIIILPATAARQLKELLRGFVAGDHLRLCIPRATNAQINKAYNDIVQYCTEQNGGDSHGCDPEVTNSCRCECNNYKPYNGCLDDKMTEWEWGT